MPTFSDFRPVLSLYEFRHSHSNDPLGCAETIQLVNAMYRREDALIPRLVKTMMLTPNTRLSTVVAFDLLF